MSRSFSGLPYIGIGAATVLGQRQIPNLDWLDTICLVLFFFLLAWLLSEGPSRDVDTGSHESAREGFAFRLGKKLNHVLNRLRRNAAVGN